MSIQPAHYDAPPSAPKFGATDGIPAADPSEATREFIVNMAVERLLWKLKKQGLAIVPLEPTEEMVSASVVTLNMSGVGRVRVRQKHRMRLRTALLVASAQVDAKSLRAAIRAALWPSNGEVEAAE
jgi:hypothetical protein